MGKCSSKKENDNCSARSQIETNSAVSTKKSTVPNKHIYGIKNFRILLSPNQEIKVPLKFEFRLSNFQCKNLKEKRYYLVQVIFGENKVFTLPIASGTNPKFIFDESIRLDILYEKMEETYMELRLYSIAQSVNIFSFSRGEDILSKASLYSSFMVDLLTIAIGPEHHDIILLDPKVGNCLGRISYNVTCNHIENISLCIQSAKLKVTHLLHHQIAFKLKFRDSQIQTETGYTDNIPPSLIQKEEATAYDWIEDQQGVGMDNKRELKINSTVSMLELRSAEATLFIYSLRLVNIDDVTPDKDNPYPLENFLQVPTQKKNTRISVHMRQSTSQSCNSCKVIEESQVVDDRADIKLIQKYTRMGYANLNFYKILWENDDAIIKQSSRFFQMSRLNRVSQCSSNNGTDNNRGGSFGNNGYTFTYTAIPDPVEFQVFEHVGKTVQEDVYWNGTPIGKIDLKVLITNVPLIRQIMCGVFTERGFELNSINVYDERKLNGNSNNNNKNSNEKDSLPNEMKLLMNQKLNLETEISNRTVLKTLTYSDKEFNAEILKIMKDIRTTLMKSSKESCMFYDYKNNKDLYKSQGVMIELGLNMLEIIDKLHLDQRAVGFDILRCINDRAEFQLGTLYRSWFRDFCNQKGYMYSTFRDNDLLFFKTIENFLLFNNNCLRFSLERLSRRKNFDKESKMFVEYFLSVAYFRIPIFRSNFLDIISSNIIAIDDINRERQRPSSIDEFLDMDPVNSLILWDNLFYKRLQSALQNNQTPNEIQEKLKETEEINSMGNTAMTPGWGNWRERLGRRDLAFFSMVMQLEKYIKNKVVKIIDIKWLNIPGFDKIIDALFHELSTREIRLLPPQLMELIPIFVNDSVIVNDFVRVIIERTNVYDVNAVYNVVQVIDSLFQEHQKKKDISHFAQKFDYHLLRRALIAVIDSDHSLCLTKFLWLYYRNAHIMNINHIAEVWNGLCIKYFYLFFFHWSWHVRNIFYYFILFIINHRLKLVISQNSNRYIRRESTSDSNDLQFYFQQMQQSIILFLDAKMKVILFLKNLIHDKNLDPTYLNSFSWKNHSELKDIPQEVHNNVGVSIQHFVTIENEFTQWEALSRQKKNNEIEYPDILLVLPKDDVVEYSSDSW